ncbi:phospholipase D family protein, partial [Roseomonas mucosa]|nr:phospholipase D family protein [Roseomonas mucosa]
METAKTLRRPHRRLLPRWRAAQPTLDQAVDEALRRIGADTGTTLVANGLEAFGLRAASARAATRSLDLQYYAWHDGITGRLL